MIKTVYITGCLGFMGSYIVRACLDKGWYVKGVDKITYASNTNLLKEFSAYANFSFVQCDINDLDFLYECDYVINTAAETHVGNSIVSSDEFVESNINGVHNLLKLIKNYRGESSAKPILLHFSTDEVYGDIDQGHHTETDLLKPSNPYSATKAAADMLVTAWSRTYSLPYIIIRPTNNYGISQYIEKLIPKSVKYLSLGRKIPLHNEGSPVRNWLHAWDTANGVMTIIEAGRTNEIYNICGGHELTNYEVVDKVISLYHSPSHDAKMYLDLSYDRVGQDVRYALDDSKIRSLGWSPLKSFDEECVSIVEYYKDKFLW